MLVRLCVALYCKAQLFQALAKTLLKQVHVCVSLSQAPADYCRFWSAVPKTHVFHVSGALVESDFVPCKYVPSKLLSGFQRCSCVTETWIRDHSKRCQHSFLLKSGCRSFSSCSLQYGEHQWNTSKAQANMLQLRLVCMAFHDIFDTCFALLAQLHLSSTFSSQSLPSLLTWFENHAKSVTSFKARCNSASLDVALGTMLCCRSNLLWGDCSNCVASSLILLSSFSSMTTCLLTDPQVHLDISPLQGLIKLQTLHLSNGTYTAAQLPMHLTEACFTDCNMLARNDSACVTSLHKLQTVCSVMKGHHQGLLYFTALESMHCQDSCIPADDMQAACNWLGKEVVEMPADLSTLARLTTLIIGFTGKSVNHDIDISCLCS